MFAPAYVIAEMRGIKMAKKQDTPVVESTKDIGAKIKDLVARADALAQYYSRGNELSHSDYRLLHRTLVILGDAITRAKSTADEEENEDE
jgi:alkylhydroperoxidase/carboxymuconolactone decarboxylase family protein YurZ